MERHKSSSSRMSSLSSPVLVCQEQSFVSRSFVMRLAVSRGMEVNKDTTSKDIITSSGSNFISLILERKELTLLTVCGDVLTSGWRISARYLDKSYVGDPGRDTIGRRGMFSLCTLGRP